MKRFLIITFAAATALMSALPVHAQEVAPGWRATGEWQCAGGRVRIVTSQPANGSFGMDFYIMGAWFDNHYTLYKGDVLYYNGTPCVTITYPLPQPRPGKPIAKTSKKDFCEEPELNGQCKDIENEVCFKLSNCCKNDHDWATESRDGTVCK